MSRYRSSIFRDVLQVSPERIAALGDSDLNLLMRALFKDRAYLCRSPLGEVRVNTEGDAKDGGCDGWTATPGIEDDWLGSRDTCWQFKAGTAGQPSRLKGEVNKPFPMKTLKAGGRFVIVASGSTSGKNGEDKRLRILANEAKASGIPIDKIEVIGSERLHTWCNQHPAVAARWADRPDGLWPFTDWANSDEHQVPWQASDTVKSQLSAHRSALDFDGGTLHHLHIYGQPGVGKTRFALELCREAAWCGSVIYIQQATAPDVRLMELIDSVAGQATVRLVVVADEVQPDQLRPLRGAVGRAEGRIRLITIGHCHTTDPVRTPEHMVRPLDRQMASAVVKGWYPAMPYEHVDFVVRFADGYIRLAWLAASAVAHGTRIDVRGLLGRNEIRAFMDGMLGSEERQALYVVAVLSSVGWTDDRQEEGRAVARHLCLEWNEVRAKVAHFHRRFGIAPSGGRYRYISPTPLGIYLSMEAWETYPDLLRSLPDALPSEAAKDAYYERLQSMASSPQARDYAREELSFFFRIEDFLDARVVRRWSALSAADPDRAARNILQALSGASLEQIASIEDRARREAVWTLVRLAWRPTSFADATKALALLAEAENETWSNNATGEFVARFQIYLGGTAVPYPDRLGVLDDLLNEGRPALSRLVVKALARIGLREFTRSVSDPASDELPAKEWRPLSGKEHFECIRSAVGRLTALAQQKQPDFQDDLVTAATKLSMMLRDDGVRSLVAGLFEAIRDAYPEAREPLRRSIADIAHRERKYWKELSPEELAKIDALHARFEDASLEARLRQHVGQSRWGQDELPDLRPIARELLTSYEVLKAEWPWLTSGEAGDAWRLGEALAKVDTEKKLATLLPSFPGMGKDLRMICSYISVCRHELGDQWYDRWVELQLQTKPKPIALLFELAWRCGATVAVARHITSLISNEAVDRQIVGQLAFVRWSDELPPDVLEEVLKAMVNAGHTATAAAILEPRLESSASERERWRSLALDMAMAPELIRSDHMANYHWHEIAIGLVNDYPGQIASAILREQADRSAGTWFAEFSEAAKVLHVCVEADPRAVWMAMLPHLKSWRDASFFSIGFPRGLIEKIPVDLVMEWIKENPNDHAEVIAKLANKDFSSDETLAARVLGAYGDIRDVSSAFFAEYTSGSWSGPASSHWAQLADTAEAAAERTKLPKLRCWAMNTANSLRKMAERDRQREEEKTLRRR